MTRVRRGYMKADSEQAFQTVVVNIAQFYGWLVYHAPAGGKGGRVDHEQIGAGFPDLVMVRGSRIVFAELKAKAGRVRPKQQVWLDALRRVSDRIEDMGWAADPTRTRSDPGVEVYLWRDDGKPQNGGGVLDQIVETLRR